MSRNRAQQRATRRRMADTGENYTTARTALLTGPLYLLTITTKHGDSHELYTSEDAAKDGVYDYVIQYWSEVGRWSDADPSAPPEDKDEAISLYFEDSPEDDWSIQPVAIMDAPKEKPDAPAQLRALIDGGLTFGDFLSAYSDRQHQEYDARARRILAKARENWQREGEIEIDDNAIVSGSDDDGDYVLAWVWQPDPGASADDEVDEDDETEEAPHPPRTAFYVDETMWTPNGYIPSLVSENEPGHSPMMGSGELAEPWYWGKDIETARRVAAKANADKGLTEEDVDEIVRSSITASIREDGRLQAAQERLEALRRGE